MICVVSAVADERTDRERRLGECAERLGMTFRQTWTAAAAVDVSDGVDECEAYTLSSAYLSAHIATCSVITDLQEERSRWVASTSIGEPPPGGVTREDDGPRIHVDKSTGATSSPENITVSDPKSYLDFIPR